MIKLLLASALLLPTASFAEVDGATCQPFYLALQQLPHESIFQRDGFFNSQLFETSAYGCFLVMITSESRLAGRSLPDLSGRPDSAFFEAGWRSNPKYLADGPGSGVVGLEKDDSLCLVYTEQPAFLDDAGQVVQTRFIRVRVECLDGARSEKPPLVLQQKRQES